MELILARHAQPAWAAPDGTARNDPELTELGRVQAERLGRHLKRTTTPIDKLGVSTARRSRETAAALERALGLDAEVMPWLVEIGAPEKWDGTPEAEVQEEIARNRQRPRDEWWDGAPGGESFRDFHLRVTDGLNALLADHGVREHPLDPDHLWDVPAGAPTLLLVAHIGTNSVITSHLLGLEPQPWEWERFASDHASLTVLRTREVGGGSIWSLEYFSDVAHLAASDVTH